ncbi:dnaJ homolog subfamily C member 24 isoform X2 [Hyla sarda]|uniref:dnaJ homolog subfamily C member 24 isoform X2 n=1 Tax=Hyla sarda TaxID=327740 RepID=UPI0024C227FB|nr:dnaJ homolog subfamily C member 24 isoform X2 [Hyla sarda]
MTSEDEDWYSILGAHPSDSQAQLKQKYQKLALLYHPDKQHRDTSCEQETEGARRFIEISRAWNILGNEETRRAYDLQRRDGEMTQSFPVDSQILLEEMIWHEEEEYYSYSCRCGGQYSAAESDLQQTSLVNCDSCSLIIEILQGSQS